MKKLIIIMACCISMTTFAQTKTTFIDPYHLDIAANKTTNLIFPFTVQSVDRGSADILVQKANGTENILHVKAGKNDFEETNLTVITTDGKLYSFLIDYSNAPEHLNLVFQKEGTSDGIINPSSGIILSKPDAHFANDNSNARELESIAQKVVDKKKMFHHLKNEHAEMKLKLQGLYVSNDVFYFQFAVSNKSNVSYDIDAIRFSTRDKQKAKRIASQETELQSLYQYNNNGTIKGKNKNQFVIAVPKFTVPDNKYLLIHILEKNGSRDLQLKLKNKHIMAAKNIL